VNPPVVTNIGDDYRLTWAEERLQAYVSLLHQEKANLTGELCLERIDANNKPQHLHRATFNFSAAESRARLARMLSQRYENLDWVAALEQTCFKILEEWRKPQPILDPWASTPTDLVYLVDKLIPMGAITLVYGDSGHGKSYWALAVGMHIATGKPFFGRHVEATRVLYCDFERTFTFFQRRCHRLAAGFGWKETPAILYRRCYHPLFEEAEDLRRAIAYGGYGFAIIDSAGYAAGEDPEGANACLRLFRSIQSLGITALVIDHVAKTEGGNTKTPFGSTYKKASADMLWHLRTTQEEAEESIHMGLWHRKANDGAILPPLGFRLTFDETATLLSTEDLRDVPELEKELTLRARLKGLLRDGPRTPAEAAEELSTPEHPITEDSVRTTFNRQKGKDFVKLEDSGWGLIHEA
jgi:hypothetical protein